MVFKRGRYYHFKFMFNGKAVQLSTKQENKEVAKKMEAQERSRLALVDAGLEAPVSPIAKGQQLTIGSLVDALEVDYRLEGKTSPQNICRVKRVRQDFGRIVARDLTAEDVDAYIQKRLAAGDAPASINRTTQVLGQAFRLAVDRGHLKRRPHIRRLSEKGNARQGFFSDAEFRAVHSHLPDDLKDFALFGYIAGWRKGEIASLAWANVEDGVVRLRGVDSKNGEPRCVPIMGELVGLIDRRRQARFINDQFIDRLFHRDGRPVGEFRKSWATACKLADVDRLFHDLRRSAVRNLVRAGVPEVVAMSISGHKTRSVFDRYNITSETDQREAMRKVQSYHRASEVVTDLVTVAPKTQRAPRPISGSPLITQQKLVAGAGFEPATFGL